MENPRTLVTTISLLLAAFCSLILFGIFFSARTEDINQDLGLKYFTLGAGFTVLLSLVFAIIFSILGYYNYELYSRKRKIICRISAIYILFCLMAVIEWYIELIQIQNL